MRKTIFACLSFALILFSAPVFAAPAPLNLSAKSAILLVASTGEVLYEKNAHAQQYPASTTKMMTIITALEDGNLNDLVTTSANAANTEGSSMYLRPQERLRLLDMLYGVALVSGNDAAVAVADDAKALGRRERRDAVLAVGDVKRLVLVLGQLRRVHERGILFAPDYVINAGGIINVGLEYLGHGDEAEVKARIARIPDRLTQVWDESDASGDPAADVADRIAKRLIGRG